MEFIYPTQETEEQWGSWKVSSFNTMWMGYLAIAVAPDGKECSRLLKGMDNLPFFLIDAKKFLTEEQHDL